MTKAKAIKKGDHLLHEDSLLAIYKRQPPSQRRSGEGDKCCIGCVLPSTYGEVVQKFEILEVREESDKIQDLSTRALGFLKGEESKSGRQVSEAQVDVGHEAGYLKVIYPEFLEVG